MTRLVEVLRYLDVGLFVVLTWVTFRLWRQHRDEASRWAFAMFACLATGAAVGLVLADDSTDPVVEYIETLLVALILLFPYFLYRMARSFTTRARAPIDLLATTVTAIVVLWAIVAPRFPNEGEPRPRSYQLFILAVLVQWVLLSAVVAVDFWRSGRAQPDVARFRMRTLSVASVLLSIAIVISGASGDERPASVGVVVQLIAIASVLSFFIAFSPPQWLRRLWRSRAEGQLRAAAIELMSATNESEVVDAILPQAAHMVGGQGILVLDRQRHVLGSYGFSPEEIAEAVADAGERPATIALEFAFGYLIVHTTPHTPFFGDDDMSLLGSLGALMNLALKRLEGVALERQLAEAKSRRRHALEINDNIVQGLAVAHYAFELGQHEKGLESIRQTLEAARRIIGELVRELPVEEQFGAETLTRSGPAAAHVPASASPAPEKTAAADPRGDLPG